MKYFYVLLIFVFSHVVACTHATQKSLHDIQIDKAIDGGTVRIINDTFDVGTVIKLAVEPDKNMILNNIYYTIPPNEKTKIQIDVKTLSFEYPGVSIIITADFILANSV
jgi:hypothetical protein